MVNSVILPGMVNYHQIQIILTFIEEIQW